MLSWEILVVRGPSLALLFRLGLSPSNRPDFNKFITTLPVATDPDIATGIKHLRNRTLRNPKQFSQLRLGLPLREFAKRHPYAVFHFVHLGKARATILAGLLFRGNEKRSLAVLKITAGLIHSYA